MKITDLDLKGIKKALNFKTASFRYHNKHKDGSGNFGTNLTKGTWNTPEWENWDISGEYDNNKEIRRLSFGKAYRTSYTINPSNNQELLILIIGTIKQIKEQEKMNGEE